MKIKFMKRIDWINHTVAFISALLGIFIAFQLDDWKDRINENKEIIKATTSIRDELLENRRMLRNEVEEISKWTSYMEFLIEHSGLNEEYRVKYPILRAGQIIASKKELGKIRANSGDKWFEYTKELTRINDSISLYSASLMNLYPYRAIKTDSWEATKATGIFQKLDQETIEKLTAIYHWLEKDFEINNDIIYGIDENKNIKDRVNEYKRIEKIYRLQLEILETKLRELKWDE